MNDFKVVNGVRGPHRLEGHPPKMNKWLALTLRLLLGKTEGELP